MQQQEAEIMEIEQHQVEKNIQLDLNVLTKILKQKNPSLGDFHFEVVKVSSNGARQTINGAPPKTEEQQQQALVEQKIKAKEHQTQMTLKHMKELKEKFEKNHNKAEQIEKEKEAT